MLQDILTMMWKERRGLFRFRGSRTRFFMTMLTPVLFALVFPLQTGPDWVDEFPPVLLSAVIPVILVGITVPESFAGERERHTLETLLASRLPDRAILFGKLAVSISFAWGVTLVVMLLSLVTVNVAHGDDGLLLFSPTIALAAPTLSLLLGMLCAGLGVIISMRSATVQEAAQLLMAIFLVPPMILQVVLLLFVDQVADALRRVDGEGAFLVVSLVLVLFNIGVFAVALARFRRSRLTLA